MTEFFVWNSVLLLPSLMVPPICPGLCSGMSITWEIQSRMRLRDTQPHRNTETLTEDKQHACRKHRQQPREHCSDWAEQQSDVPDRLLEHSVSVVGLHAACRLRTQLRDHPQTFQAIPVCFC